ncbi:MAG: hypothetical protein JXA08_08660 [Methanomicrobiaceae archaeon]|nr:hypothetical protein [Methanomicrobiaceae archaeon]
MINNYTAGIVPSGPPLSSDTTVRGRQGIYSPVPMLTTGTALPGGGSVRAGRAGIPARDGGDDA